MKEKPEIEVRHKDGKVRGFEQETLYSIRKSGTQDFDWDLRQEVRRGTNTTITLFSFTEGQRKRLIKLLSSIEKRRDIDGK